MTNLFELKLGTTSNIQVASAPYQEIVLVVTSGGNTLHAYLTVEEASEIARALQEAADRSEGWVNDDSD